MHSGRLLSREDCPSFPGYAPQTSHQELAFSPASRPGRLLSFSPGAGWCLEAPSDVDLENEQHLPAALSRAEDKQNTPLHAANTPSPTSPIPMPAANTSSSSFSASPAAMFLAAFSPNLKPAPLPDDEGQNVAGYTLGGIIGYGGFSVIRRAFSASGGMVAVKIVKKSDIQKQSNPALVQKKLDHEAEIWSSLSHEHILPLFSAVHTSYADFFVTLFCPAGSLYDILQRDGTPALPQDDAGMMFRQLVRGLRYLHEVAMYVHRDIKLENVLVDEMGVCRIGDFGMSKKIGEIDEDDLESDVEERSEHFRQQGNVTAHRAATISGSVRRHGRSSLQPPQAAPRHGAMRHRNSTSSAHPTHVCQPGSLPYASPEILLPQTRGSLHPHPAQDIWALGVLLYALLTGRFPFCDSFEPRLQMKILHGTFELPTGIGRGAERVLQGCLERTVQQRWSIAMVDEVAWGVGWGSEGDDVTPTDSDEEYETHCQPSTRPSTRPPSRSRSRPPPLNDLPSEDPRTRPAREAASRRSASRAKRSLSRAPVPTHHQSYSRRSVSRGVISRHNSRAPSPSPTSSGLSNSIMSSAESPFLPSPTSSVDRGRRPFRCSPLLPSRSPSPSVVPGTPVDFGSGFSGSFNASLPVVDDQPDVDELSLDSVEEEERRGRSKSTREIRVSPLSFTASDNSDNDNINISVGVRRRDNGRWGHSRNDEEANTGVRILVGDDDVKPSFLGSPEKERSRSCGYSLRAPSSSSSPLSDADGGHRPGMDRPHPLHHQNYQHYEPYEYDHESWTKRRNKRTGSTPPTPVTPGAISSPLSPSPGRPPANGQSHSGKTPITAAIINDFLKKKSEPSPASADYVDVVTRPAMAKRGRSVDRGIGWS